MHKLNLQRKTSKFYHFGLSFFILIFAFYIFLLPSAADAGFLINRPLYIGLTDGLVGYWSFNGADIAADTAYDRSGNANNGTLTNGPVRTEGKIGQALSFDGTDDYVNLGDMTPTEGQSTLTWAFWTKANYSGNDSCFLCKVELTNQTQNSWGITNTPSSWFGTTRDVRVYIPTSLSDTSTHCNTPNNALTSGAWNHVVVVFDGTQTGNTNRIKFYINGTQKAFSAGDCQGTIPASALSSTANAMIGASSDPNNYYNGLIDDVRIYNRVLSPDEIKRLYNIGSTFKINKASNTGSLQDGLVGYWSFDGPDMNATQARDTSGNANHGTLTNGPARTIGKIGQGLRFDGLNDRVNSPSAPSLVLSSSITVSTWVKSENLKTGYMDIFDKRSPSVDNNYVLEVVEGISGAARKVGFFYYSSGGVAQEWQTTNAVLPPNEWTHIAVTFTFGAGSSMRIFVNGVSEPGTWSEGNGNLTPANDDGGFGIGALQNGSNEFDGTIDDVRIYNRALSAEEIKRLYKMGATTKINVSRKDTLKDGLVGSWTFDGPDMAVDTAYDRSGNANNGTLTNGPVRTEGKIGQALNFDGVNDYVDLGGGGSVAVLRDANGTRAEFASGAGPNNYTGLTVGNRPNLALVVEIAWGAAGNPGTVTVTWDQGGSNQALALIKDQANTGNRRASLYGLVNPAQGNKTLRITHSNTIGLIVNATSYYNVDQTGGVTTFPNSTSATGTGTSAALSITSASDNATVSVMSAPTGSGTTDQTLLWFLSGAGAQDGGASENVGGGTVTHTWTIQNVAWAVVGTDIKAAAAAGPSLNTESVSFWMKNATSTTQKILDLNSTATITDNSGTITANNFTSPTIYVDGVVSSTVNDTNWHHVVVTTNTAITADAIKFGVIGSTYFGGSLDEVRIYNRALSPDEIRRLYNMGR